MAPASRTSGSVSQQRTWRKTWTSPAGFDALKAKVTGSGAVSLGKAIGGFAPNADAKAEAKKANKQASDDLKETSS